MAKRTQTYIKVPWNGGINDAVDPGMLPDNDLVVSQNVVYGTAGSRLKRLGLGYFDSLDVPTATSVDRSGTTVTITFSSDIQSATNQIFFVGERIAVLCDDSEFSTADVAITAIPADDQISFEVSGTPTAASATLTSITRLANIVGMHDFWYYDLTSNSKLQQLIVVNSDAQVFRYSSGGERIYLPNKTYAVTLTDSGDTVTLVSHGLVVGDLVSFTSITDTTGISINQTYYVGGSITTDTFQLTTTRGGITPITLTTNGSATAVSPLFTTSITSASFVSINERCFIAFDGIGNTPKMYEPQTSTTTIRGVVGAPPNANYCREHQGRVWADDKEQYETLQYSSTFNPDEWAGSGDSGELNIGFGDGDPEGLTTIFPPFKGTLFTAKRDSLYRVDGTEAAGFTITPMSLGVGAVGNAAVAAIDMDDVAYVSHKGIHSLVATNTYGDFQSPFLSEKIQNKFKSLVRSVLHKVNSVYIPTDNVIYFSLPTGDTSSTTPDDIYLYNTKFKEWSNWPEIVASSLGKIDLLGTKRLLIGSSGARIIKQLPETYTDFDTNAYTYKIKTGAIYVDGNPSTLKAFKRIGFILKPRGSYSFSAKINIDNYATQLLVFTQTTGSAQLGVDFILGETTLAGAYVLGPYTLPLDGRGKGITVTIEETATEQEVEVYGLVIEWEPANMSQETIERSE